MKPARNRRALAFIVAGLFGIGSYWIAELSHLPIIPSGDFAKGLWFGTCLGSELLGLILTFKARGRRAI